MAEEGLPGAKRASDQASRFREAMEKIRQRTDYTSKGLAAVGTAAIAGIGYAKLADVFPWAGWSLAIAALAVGAVLMIAAVLLLVFRFAAASESVFTSSDLAETFDRNRIVDPAERSLIQKVYCETAKQNRATSLSAYEERALQLEIDADEEKDPKKAGASRARADKILNEIQAAQDRAGALLLRHRAHRAVFGWGMALWVSVFIVGWYATALGADSLQSEHSDQVALAKSCAEARAAEKVVKDDIPDICGTQLEKERAEEEAEEKKTAATTRREGITALASAVETCQNTAEENEEESKNPCRGLERALLAALEAGGGSSEKAPTASP
jgi:hypothetical protein